MEHGVAQRDQHTQDSDQAARPREPAAGTVDDRLHGEADGRRQPGKGALVQKAPGHGLELAAQLIAAEPEKEAWA
ncbi:hypothetical protein GCM10010207_59580 [Streptomyces atratus]|nr:hypothetical protein GCM10010207_59580 [Streptomyces atratus]